MINAILEFLLAPLIVTILILGIIVMIKSPKGSGFASLTAFHDQAEKKMEEQESGKDKL